MDVTLIFVYDCFCIRSNDSLILDITFIPIINYF